MERQASLLKNIESHFQIMADSSSNAQPQDAVVSAAGPLAIHLEEMIRRAISEAMASFLRSAFSPEQQEKVAEVLDDIEARTGNIVEKAEDVLDDVLETKEDIVEEAVEIIDKIIDPLPDEIEDEIRKNFLDRIVSTEKKVNAAIRNLGLTIRHFPGVHQHVEILKSLRSLLTPTVRYQMEHKYINHPLQQKEGEGPVGPSKSS